MSPSRSGDEVDLPGVAAAPTTRQAPNALGERERARRRPRARARARPRSRRRRRPRGRGRRSRRPSSRSRTAPPTSQAALAGERRARDVQRRGHAGSPSRWYARGTRARDPAGDLVVDRAEPRGELLGEDPLAALAPISTASSPARDAGVRAEVDGDVVHRDRADERHAAAADQHLGVVRQRRAARRRRSRSASCRASVGALGRRSAARSRRSRPARSGLTSAT